MSEKTASEGLKRLETTPIGTLRLSKSKKCVVFDSDAGTALISLKYLKAMLNGEIDFVRVRLIVE